MSDLTSSLPGMLILAALILLALAALLMPLYVIHISAQVDKMRVLMERLLWQAEQQAKRDLERR